ncbi:MAG: cbb3-type cytochrome c oxidase subunit I [Verrucomicrobia bacterium]|nr:cbb3-type cytochrome c oxidase subunit I [Verrucomicrobiota bacterium]
MNAPASQSQSSPIEDAGALAASPAESDASCRYPVLYLMAKAAGWLVLSSIFSLLDSLKFHSPNILADCSWLTYGRVQPAQVNMLIYGFAIQAGVGVALWLIARLGRTTLLQPGFITVSAAVWNLGVAIGVLGILAGDSTGFEWLEMPRYASPILLLAYALMSIWALMTFQQRREHRLYVSQWFLLAALFWFPWIYSTANLLLVVAPVRGTLQAAINWWYVNNLSSIWLGFVGLAAIFYFIPKLINRPLHSNSQARFAFWLLVLFGGWGGFPDGAPLPAWMPSLSTVLGAMTILSLIALAINLHLTLKGQYSKVQQSAPLKFILFGLAAFMLGSLSNIASSLHPISEIIRFTWFTAAQKQLVLYGFFAMTMFGAFYYIIPRLMQSDRLSARLIKWHFWCAAAGTVLYVLPLSAGGVVEGFRLNDANVGFADVLKSTLMFLRISTIGDVSMLIGNCCLLANLSLLFYRCCRSCCIPAIKSLTKTEVMEVTS